MIKFVSADVSAFVGKRKANPSPRACENCRRRKKRCTHSVTSQGLQASTRLSNVRDDVAENFSSILATRNDTQARRATDDSGETARSSVRPSPVASRSDHQRRSDTLRSQFIGDLNPEGVFFEATSPDATRGPSSNERIGVWLAEKLQNNGVPAEPDGTTPPTIFYGFTSMIHQILVPLLKQESLAIMPPPTDLRALTSSYFEKFHPIFPVINESRFKELASNSPTCILLQQGVCLVGSMNFSLSRHLRLTNNETLLSHQEFSRRLIAAMRTSIEIGLVTDKIVLIQALSLMSFFTDDLDGREESSLRCGRAVHCVHSLGLHIQESQRDQANDYIVTLLCCVWGLDRLNAAFNGRPVLMHERDLGRDLDECIDMQQPAFRLLLRVILLLDRVISIYRPGSYPSNSDWERDFTLFEDLIANCDAVQLPTSLLATIETLYHAVAILSSRTRSSVTTYTSSSASQTRQSLSAGRVTSIVGQEFRNQIILFPFIPYAVSLSLSIAYREMRHSRVPMYRLRARTAFQNNCYILENLGKIFWSASIMADMGKATLRELDRVYSTVAQSQHQGRQTLDLVAQQQKNTSINSRAQSYSTAESSVSTRDEHAQDTRSTSIEATGSLEDPFAQQPTLNYAFLDDMPGLDAFELFDPNFDLDGIDAFLESNLDLSFPTNL